MAQVPCIYRAEGDSVPYTPASATPAGTVVVLGSNIVSITKVPIAADDLGAVHLEGIFEVPKVTGAIAPGDPLFWDDDADPVGGDTGSGAFVANSPWLGPFGGFATPAVDGDPDEAAASADETVRMKLAIMADVLESSGV